MPGNTLGRCTPLRGIQSAGHCLRWHHDTEVAIHHRDAHVNVFDERAVAFLALAQFRSTLLDPLLQFDDRLIRRSAASRVATLCRIFRQFFDEFLLALVLIQHGQSVRFAVQAQKPERAIPALRQVRGTGVRLPRFPATSQAGGTPAPQTSPTLAESRNSIVIGGAGRATVRFVNSQKGDCFLPSDTRKSGKVEGRAISLHRSWFRR